MIQPYFLHTRKYVISLCVFTLLLNPLWANNKAPDNTVDLQDFYAKAFGAAAKIPSQLDLTLQVQKKDVATIKSYSDDKKNITHVDAVVFLTSIETFIEAEYFNNFLKKTANKQRLSVAYLKEEGLLLLFDRNSLSLTLIIATEMRLPIKLNIGRPRRKISYPADSQLAAPAKVSAYVNFDANIDHDYSTENTRQRLTAESVVNIKGVVLENQYTWRNDRAEKLTRNYTRISIDKPKSLQRFTVGDINTEYRNYQQSIHLGGLKVEKSLSLNPYLNTRSASQQRFKLEQDSEVKIYINGFFKDKKKLDAGDYTLTDLNLESGANSIRLEITDEDGNVTEQDFSLLNDRRLLQSGVSTYAMEIGKPAYRTSNEYQYDADTTIFSGYYKRGFGSKLTAGASIVSDGKNTQVGADVFMPTPIGGIIGKVSVVKEANEDSTHAAGFHYQYSSPSAVNNTVNFGLSGDYFDENFAALNYSHSDTQLLSANNHTRKTRLNASLSKPLGEKIQGGINIQRETSYDNDDIKYSASINLRKSFKNGNSLSTRLRYRDDDDKNTSINMRLHIPLSSKADESRYKTLDTSYSSIDSSIINRFFVGPENNTGSGSLAGALTHYTRETSDSLNANVSYRSNYAELAASHSISKAKYANQEYKHRTQLKLKTALSFADGEYSVSKPIRGSFALVTGPDNQDKAIAVVKGRSSFTYSQGNDLPDHYQSLINNKGSAAVINLPNYRYNSINVDSTALPTGSNPDETEFEVKPKYRQGYLLKAGGEPGVIVDGRLLDSLDQPLVLAGGQLVASNLDYKPIDFFTNSTGRFRLISVPSGTYKLELFDDSNTVKQTVIIPNKIGETYNVGEIRVEEAMDDR